MIIHKAQLSKGETLPEGVADDDGLILVSLTKKIVAIVLCKDYPAGPQVYHTTMIEELGWPATDHDVAVRIVLPPEAERCYWFASVYAGIGPIEIPYGCKEFALRADHQAAKHFVRAAQIMIAVGLPNLPVVWQIVAGQQCESGDLRDWAYEL